MWIYTTYVHTDIYIYTLLYLYMYIHVHMYIYIYIYIYYTYTYTYTIIYAYAWAYAYTYIYLYMCICSPISMHQMKLEWKSFRPDSNGSWGWGVGPVSPHGASADPEGPGGCLQEFGELRGLAGLILGALLLMVQNRAPDFWQNSHVGIWYILGPQTSYHTIHFGPTYLS